MSGKERDRLAVIRRVADRELRLAGISDMAGAQAFLPGFMARYNAKFAVAPRVAEDAHKAWEQDGDALEAALAERTERRLSKALTFMAGGAVHCIRTRHAGIAYRGAKVVVRRYLDGRMDVVFKDRLLSYTTLRRLAGAAEIEDEKTLDARVDAIVARSRETAPAARGGGWLGL